MDNTLKIKPGLDALAAEIPLCEAERAGAVLYGAPDFSVFSLFGDRETTLSRVLADLLNPIGSHGQGTLFLNVLLHLMKHEDVGRFERNIKVETEAAVRVRGKETQAPRRLDILVETSAYVIGIENKKWTGESKNQLSDYYSYLVHHPSQKKPILIFVSNDKPSVPEAIQFPYFAAKGDQSIDAWLRIARDKVKAPRIRDFIDDFRGWIVRTFTRKGSGEMTIYADMISDVLKNSRDHEKAVGAVLVSYDEIRRSYVRKVEDHLKKELTAEFEDIEFNSLGPDEYRDRSLDAVLDIQWEWWVARRPNWPKNAGLAISSDGGGWTKIIYGLAALNPGSEYGRSGLYNEWHSDRIETLQTAADGYRHLDGATDWWRWSQYMPTRDWTMGAIGNAILCGERFPGESLGIGRALEELIGLGRAVSAAMVD